MKKKLIFLFFLILLSSCRKDDLLNNNENINKGCFLYANGNNNIVQQISTTSGNSQLDNAILGDFNTVVNTFGLNGSVLYYFNDGSSPNAYFNTQNKNIYLGLNLLNSRLANQNGDGGSIPFIIAHELGHAKMYKMNWNFSYGNTMKKNELFADFVSGTYLYDRPNFTQTNIQTTIQDFLKMGDYEFNSPYHHGTPQERVNALLAGYQHAYQYRTSTMPLAQYEKYRDSNGNLDFLYAAARTFLDNISE